MEKPKYHIILCGSFRVSGETQGMCHKKGAIQYIPYIEEGLRDRDVEGNNDLYGRVFLKYATVVRPW